MNRFFSHTGYREDSADKDRPYNIIPSNRISMKNVDKELLLVPIRKDGVADSPVKAKRNEEYYFPDHSHIIEVPINAKSMKKLKKYGGPTGNGNLKKADQSLLYGNYQMGGSNIDPLKNQSVAIPGTTGIYSNAVVGQDSTEVPYARSYVGPQGQPVYIKYNLPAGTPKNPTPANYLENPSAFANASVQSMTPEEYAAFVAKHPSQITKFKGDVRPSFNSGGENNLNNKNLLEDNKNNFLNWLRNTSMDAIQQDMEKHSSFHHMPDGSIMSDVDMEEAGYMRKGGNWIQKAVNPKHKGYCTPMTKSTCTPRRKAFAMTMKKHHGFHKQDGGTHLTYEINDQGDIPDTLYNRIVSNQYENDYTPAPYSNEEIFSDRASTIGHDAAVKEYNKFMTGEQMMAYGGSRKKGKGSLSSYCGGRVNSECITMALNSPDPAIRKMAVFVQSMRKVRMQPGGPVNDCSEQEKLDPMSPCFEIPGSAGTSYFSDINGNMVPADMLYNPANTMNPQNMGMESMTSQQTQGQPNNNQTRNQNQFDNESLVNFGIAGMDFLTNMVNQGQTRKRQQQLRGKTRADQVFLPTTGNAAGNRGDYSVNEGYFQPNNMVPVQFQGNAGQWRKYGGDYQVGGEYYLSDDVIQKIIEQGGEIDFIDE